MWPERTAVVHHILLRYFEFYSDKMVLPRHGAQCRIGAGRGHPGTPCDGIWCSVEDPDGGVAYIVSWGRKCRCGHLVVPAANPNKCWVVWRGWPDARRQGREDTMSIMTPQPQHNNPFRRCSRCSNADELKLYFYINHHRRNVRSDRIGFI